MHNITQNILHQRVTHFIDPFNQVGKLLDSKGYGIAFTPGSHYRVLVDRAILKLQEEGIMHMLKDK